jgi:trimethylamine--corrinoid protein Co-methyltransferase
MRPIVRFLSDELIDNIVSEAFTILQTIGVEIQNDVVLRLLGEHGVKVDIAKRKAFISQDNVSNALKTARHSFQLFDVLGNQTHDFAGMDVHFTPGSAAINVLDSRSGEMCRGNTDDYVRYAKIMTKLPHIASQSTAFIPSDVHDKISDSYRLFLSLLYCEKPVVTGTFTIEAFEVMKNLQLAVRGSAQSLWEKPLTIFSCCPTSPLKWSDVTSQNVIDCAKYHIPVEFISMPLSGFMAPVTLVGSLIQHTAETLSGVVISQCAQPGTPMLYGGSPAIFDVRYETTPMGAIETMMIDCAYNEIGKHFGLPTQAYTSMSDAKLLDMQAGLETGMGAMLAALAGVNNISGPGMHDFESCFSLEKLVIDNEICGMTLRMIQGIEPREDFPALPIFQEMLQDGHLLISKHTRRNLKKEHYFPGASIDRANRGRWKEEGSQSMIARVQTEIGELLKAYEPSRLPSTTVSELVRLMEAEARRYGQSKLPQRDQKSI